MKILLLISEVWNDRVYPNNNMSNWFTDMPNVQIATIYASPGIPENKCCSQYFQITESTMVKSLVGGGTAGSSFRIDSTASNNDRSINRLPLSYRIFRKFSSEFIRLIRDIIWSTGKINILELEGFIKDFNPDIVFSQRMGTIKMCRIERIVSKLTDAPFVAYTGDDEYSLNHYNFSPIFWIRKLWVRQKLKKNIPMYRIFYSQSGEQMSEFKKDFNSNTKFLVKCGVFEKEKIHYNTHNPIEIVYAGKLYCNRWKTLSLLVECIKQINSTTPKIKLRIYTRDKITSQQNKLLNDGINSQIMGEVSAIELNEIYKESDILLHVESFDKKNRLLTKYSFSTKIMECLSSGCAVMAIGSGTQAGCEYLKNNDAAIVASSRKEILEQLTAIVDNPNLIVEYALKAYQCGSRYHKRDIIQKLLISDFQNVIHNSDRD